MRDTRRRVAQRIACGAALVGRHELGFCMLVGGRFLHDGSPLYSPVDLSQPVRQVFLDCSINEADSGQPSLKRVHISCTATGGKNEAGCQGDVATPMLLLQAAAALGG